MKTHGDRALAQVPSDDALNLFLDPESNSIVVIVRHLAGNFRSRWTDFLISDGEKPNRNRDGEFDQARRLTRDETLAEWENGWSALFKAVDTPEKMLALGEEGLREQIKSIGLYRAKAKNVIALAKILVEKHAGKVPGEREALEALPGVGRKTANVVLNIVFGEPTIAVDTHLFRVGNRTGLAPGKTPFEVEKGLLKVVPKQYLRHAHHWLILHGRYICKARRPECWRCPIVDLCQFREKTPAPA